MAREKRRPGTRPDPDIAALEEELRGAVSTFVRTVRRETGTPRSAKSDTLEILQASGGASIAALAEIRNVKHQSMRLVTAQLEADGLVRRRPDDNDRRSQLLSITAKGRKWLQDSRRQRARRIGEMIASRLAKSDHDDLRTAVRLLRQLVDGGEH